MFLFVLAIMAAEERRKQKEQIKILKQQVGVSAKHRNTSLLYPKWQMFPAAHSLLSVYDIYNT